LFGFFERHFARLRDGYTAALTVVLNGRRFVLLALGGLVVLTGVLFVTIGTAFSPTADVGIIKLHYRAPPGLRIEETEKSVLAVEKKIREIIPATELRTINDMDGPPLYYHLAFAPTA